MIYIWTSFYLFAPYVALLMPRFGVALTSITADMVRRRGNNHCARFFFLKFIDKTRKTYTEN